MIPLKSCLPRSSPFLFRQSNWSQLHWGTLSMVCPCQTNIILREKLFEKARTLQQFCWSYCKMKVIWSLVGKPLTFMSHLSFLIASRLLITVAPISSPRIVERRSTSRLSSYPEIAAADVAMASDNSISRGLSLSLNGSTVDGSRSKRSIVVGDIVRRSSSESESSSSFQLWIVMFDIYSGFRSLRSARFKDLSFAESISSSKELKLPLCSPWCDCCFCFLFRHVHKGQKMSWSISRQSLVAKLSFE